MSHLGKQAGEVTGRAMRQVNFSIDTLDSLAARLDTAELRAAAATASAVLVQIFSADGRAARIADVAGMVQDFLPAAVVVGISTVGEVLDGRTVIGTTTVAISFFATTRLTLVGGRCAPGGERAAGIGLGRAIAAVPEAAGVLLLATPISLDAATLLDGLSSTCGALPVFGGGAGDYEVAGRSAMALGRDGFETGAAAVVFSGPDLRIEARTYLGWQALSRAMTATAVDGMVVRTVDDAPAFDIYRRYLGLVGTENFFLNALEFPFLIERGGETLARVPVAVEADGALRFVADIGQGETFRLGYGNPSLIVRDAHDIRAVMDDFAPEAVFLYTCGCRRFLMQDDADLETTPFQTVAPTAGFYTYGEFFGRNGQVHLLNSAMVAVGMREGVPADRPLPVFDTPGPAASGIHDPYANQHARVVSRLVRFIGAVTDELNASNAELSRQSATDRLTQTYNRGKLDQVLADAVARAGAGGEDLAIVLLDIDHFKQVNDTHGHHAGDAVIVLMVAVVREVLAGRGIFGRWGGEEFLLILPGTGVAAAADLAEAIRARIAATDFAGVGRKTASFGVAGIGVGDTVTALLGRADQALYRAKRAGRDQVAIG